MKLNIYSVFSVSKHSLIRTQKFTLTFHPVIPQALQKSVWSGDIRKLGQTAAGGSAAAGETARLQGRRTSLLGIRGSWHKTHDIRQCGLLQYLSFSNNQLEQNQKSSIQASGSTQGSSVPEDRRRPSGRPRQSWLRTIERNLKTQNIGFSLAWHIAHRRSRWHRVEETAIYSLCRVKC